MMHIRYLRIVINYDIYSLFIDDISYDISSLFYDDNSYDTPSPIDYIKSEDQRSSKNTHRSQQRSALHKEAKPKQKSQQRRPKVKQNTHPSQQRRPKVKQKRPPEPTAKRLGV